MPFWSHKILLLLGLMIGIVACNYSIEDGSQNGTGIGQVDIESTDSSSTAGTTTTLYQDSDGDGFGDPETSLVTASAPAGYVANKDDCNDTNAAIHPDAKDPTHDGIDHNCDGIFMYLPTHSEHYSGDFSSPLISHTHWEFNLDEKKAEFFSDSRDPAVAPILIKAITFNDKGRIVLERQYSPRSRTYGFIESVYNDNNILTMIRRGIFDAAGNPVYGYSEVFTHDDSGHKIKEQRYDGDPTDPATTVPSSFIWVFNDEGQTTQFKRYPGNVDDGATPSLSEQYTFDSDGHLEIATRHTGDIDGPIEWSTRSTYNDDGKRLSYKKYVGDLSVMGASIDYSVKLDYDDAGNLAEYKHYRGDFDDPTLEPSKRYVIQYNDEGYRNDVRFYYGGIGAPLNNHFTWTYDEHGNVLEQEKRLGSRISATLELLTRDQNEPRSPELKDGYIRHSEYVGVPFDYLELSFTH